MATVYLDKAYHDHCFIVHDHCFMGKIKHIIIYFQANRIAYKKGYLTIGRIISQSPYINLIISVLVQF